MNLPGCKVELPTITKKDEYDLKNFAVKYNVDLVALSFCRSGKDVQKAREILG